MGENGEVAVAGSLNTNNFYVAMLDGSDGSTLWTNSMKGVDPTARVYVSDIGIDSAGVVSIIGGDRDVDVMRMQFSRFDAATGALLWKRSRSGATNIDRTIGDAAGVQILCTDSQIVTASVEAQRYHESPQILIATYSAEAGGLQWEKRFGISSPAPYGIVEQATELSLDAKGNLLLAMRSNVYLTNRSYSAVLNIDISTGELLWESLHPFHYVYSMASHGDFFVLSGNYYTADRTVGGVTFVGAYGKVPELITTRQTDGAYVLRWSEDYSGWALRSTTLPLSNSPLDWTELSASRNTNEFRISAPPGPGRLYQLAR